MKSTNDKLSGEILWECVMKYFDETETNENRFHWRYADQYKTECHHCIVKGGGPIIKCCVDRCKREYHMECGFIRGAFFLDENQTVTFFCEVHHKPILFCTCLQPYDVNKSAEMVCCDECIEWFHISCVGLSNKEAASMDKYICPKCTQLHREGKTISPQEKDRNIKKEQKSSNQQEASKSLRILVEISETICPLIDQLNFKEKNSYTVSQMKDAENYLSSDLFTSIHKKFNKTEVSDQTSNSEPAKTKKNSNPSIIEPVNFFNTDDIIYGWYRQLKQFLSNYNHWIIQFQSVSKQYKQQFLLSLHLSQIPVIDQFIQIVQDILNKSKELPVPDIGLCTEFLEQYVESWNLIKQFIEILHGDNTSKAWLRQVESHLKLLNSRIRKLQLLVDQDNRCLEFYIIIDHVKMISQTTDRIINWIHESQSIIQGGSEEVLTVRGFESMIAVSEEFPIKLSLVQDLKQILDEASRIDDEVIKCLEKDDITLLEYQELESKAMEQRVQILHIGSLQKAGECLSFLQNYDSMMNAQRTPIGTIEQLQLLSDAILQETDNDEVDEDDLDIMRTNHSIQASKTFNLISNLQRKVLEAKNEMQSLLKDTESFFNEASQIISTLSPLTLQSEGESFGESELIKLRGLRVITDEEMIIEFIQKFSFISSKVSEIKVASVPQSISNASKLRIDLEHILQTAPVTEEYSSFTETRRLATETLNMLIYMEEHSTRMWQDLKECIGLCREGGQVTYEEYSTCYEKAVSTNLCDPEVQNLYFELETEASNFVSECDKKLLIIKHYKEDWESIYNLYERMKFLPISKKLSDDINLRYQVFHLINRCNDALNSALTEHVPIVLIRKLHRELQELCRNIQKHKTLMQQTNYDVEESTLEIIREKFELFYWKQEIAAIIDHGTSKKDAEYVFQLGQELNVSVHSPYENSLLIHEMEVWNQYEREFELLSQIINDAKQSSNEAIIQSSNSNVTRNQSKNTNEFDLMSFISGAKAWKTSLADIYTKLRDLMNRKSNLKITKPETLIAIEDLLNLLTQIHDVSVKVTDIHIAMDTKESSSSLSQANPILDFKDLTSLVNEFSRISAKYDDFQLVSIMSNFLYNFHSQASMWNDSAQSLFSSKSSRRKSKGSYIADIKTIHVKEMEDLKNNPVCRAIMLPAYDTIVKTLETIKEVEKETINIIKPKLVSSGIRSNELSSEITIQEDIDIVQNLISKIDTLPFEINETKILNWFSDLLCWFKKIPAQFVNEYFSKDKKLTPGQLTLEQAMSYVADASKLIEPIPSYIDDWLFENKVIIDDGDNSDMYFHEDATPYFYKSQEIFEGLKSLIEATEMIQSSMETGLSGEEPITNLSHVITEAKQSPIIIDRELQISFEVYYNRVTKEENEFNAKKRSRISIEDKSTFLASTSTKSSKKFKTGSSYKCMNKCCNHHVIPDSYFCSSDCATKTTPDLIKDLSVYRDVLCSDKPLPQSIRKIPGIVDMVGSDRSAFQISPISAITIFDQINSELTRRGLITTSISQDKVQGNRDNSEQSVPTDLLENLLIDGERFQRRILSEAGKFSVTTDKSSKNLLKMSLLQAMLATLPSYAATVFARPVPAESPRDSVSPSSRSGVGNSTSGHTSEYDMRKTVRYNFEDVFIAALSRQGLHGALCMAAILALELEQELYNKYYMILNAPGGAGGTTGSSDGKKELNRKEYRAQQIMLYRNLKQTHNDHLIVRLAKMEISVESLLNMTPQQLADASTQSLRAKQINSALQESQIKQSVQDALEARCRVALAGNESWRSKDIQDQAANPLLLNPDQLNIDKTVPVYDDTSSAPQSPTLSPRKDLDLKRKLEEQKKCSSRDDFMAVDTDIEESEHKSSHQSKRNINVDSVSRYTTDRPKKKRETTDIPAIHTNTTDITKSDHDSTPSPKEISKTKAPNVLELLKASAIVVKEEKRAKYLTYYKLLSSTGSTNFTINRPGSPTVDCIGLISDKRMQGLLRSTISIEGRTRVAELERFVQQIVSAGRKSVVPFRFYTHKNLGSSSGYQKFCEEFVRDGRAGVSNIADQVQVYILPPALKDSITVLQNYNIIKDVDRALYGLIITKESGPTEYRTGAIEECSIDDPPEPDFSEISKDSSEDSSDKKVKIHSHSHKSKPVSITSSSEQSKSLVPDTISSNNKVSATMANNSLVVPKLPITPTTSQGMSIPPPNPVIVPTIHSSLNNPIVIGHATQSLPSPVKVSVPPPFPIHMPPNILPSSVPVPGPVLTRTVSAMPQPPQLPPNRGMPLSSIPSISSIPNNPSFSQFVANTPVVPPVVTPAPIPTSQTLISGVTSDSTIYKVAQFCATHGVKTIELLKSKEDAANRMPFLFPSHPDHATFTSILRSILYPSSSST